MQGIIRRIDDLGRVAIPREIRRSLGIVDGDPLELSLDPEQEVLVIKRYNTLDELLGSHTCSVIMSVLQERVGGCAMGLVDFAGRPIKRYAPAQMDGELFEKLGDRRFRRDPLIIDCDAAVPIITTDNEVAGYIILSAGNEGKAGQEALRLGIEQARTVAAMVRRLAI